MNHKRWLVAGIVLCLGIPTWTQTAGQNQELARKAQREFVAGNFADAERDFAELARREPSNIVAQMYLGHSLFRQEKYAAAVGAYEKVRDLEKSGKRLSVEQHRVLVDQLAMAYGISGQTKSATTLLQDAIKDDPEYPLNYYNLACAYADEGNKEKVLKNLSLAFDRKGQVLKGERMPDPRTDSSFRRYARDEDFIKLMKKLGYK